MRMRFRDSEKGNQKRINWSQVFQRVNPNELTCNSLKSFPYQKAKPCILWRYEIYIK